ncbi:hypothetical protein UFOVP707_10 [uncultured Caudovirales phage]|uniref:Uncharacterized protein n=1 Tax=uncultured Caudovirales phage TaxID=2100421 RepID=A0A6J5NLE0_9CAUD|nr:hypothetical protein UFOVP707_10 [uncultured Caudovirales phage]
MPDKHAPRPWHIGDETSPLISDSSGRYIAQVLVYDESGSVLPDYDANARLMAAAPELLELVRRLALITDEGDDQIKGAAYIDRAGVIRAKGSLLETINLARAAIAKATGEPA